MFLGQYERSLDDKGRLAVPPELRSRLGSGAVITRSFDTCLSIYPAAKWETVAQAVDDLPQVRYEARGLARALFSSAMPCEFDRQGRITVPVFLREYAGLTGEVIIVGVNSHVEIWSKDAWLRERRTFEVENSALSQVLAISGA